MASKRSLCIQIVLMLFLSEVYGKHHPLLGYLINDLKEEKRLLSKRSVECWQCGMAARDDIPDVSNEVVSSTTKAPKQTTTETYSTENPVSEKPPNTNIIIVQTTTVKIPQPNRQQTLIPPLNRRRYNGRRARGREYKRTDRGQ